MKVCRVYIIFLATTFNYCDSFSILGGSSAKKNGRSLFSSLHSSLLEEGVRSQPPPNAVDFLFPPEESPHYESRLMEYGTMVQEYADVEYGLNSEEYYLTPSGGSQQFFHLYVWDTDRKEEKEDTQQQQQTPLARSFDARLICQYSYSTDTFRWESNNPRSIPGFDQAINDLNIRSRQDSQICPTTDLFRELVNYPFEKSDDDSTKGISCRDSTGDMTCWLVSYLILSKQNQPVAIYTAPMNNGEGRAWFLLSNPKFQVPIPAEAVEMHTKTRELMESSLSQRPEIFGLGKFATSTEEAAKKDTSGEDYDEEADIRRDFLERLFSVNPDTQEARMRTAGTSTAPGAPEFSSPESDDDFETSVWNYGRALQEHLYASHQIQTYDNFEIVPSWEDPKQFMLYFFKEEGGKMEVLQFKLIELCALLYPEQAFWSILDQEDEDLLSVTRSLKLRSHSDKCHPGDSRLFYLISNALTKGKQSGLQLQDLQPSVFGKAFEDFGWFFSFLLKKNQSGIVSIPTENIGTNTEPDFGGPLQNPGRAWYALEEVVGEPHLVPQTMLTPSHEEYEQAICHASRVQSALMGDLYDITADTNIYIDAKNQQLYCWNDDLKSSIPLSQLKGKRFQLKQVGSFSYSDSTFAFPEGPEYWLKTAIVDLEMRSREKDNSLFIALIDAFRAGGRVGIPNDIGDSIGWLLASICLTKAEEGLSILPDKPLILGKHEMVWYILSKPEHDVGIPSEALAGKKKMQDLA